MIKKYKSLRPRMIFINLVLPVNLIIFMLVLFVQFWFLQFDVSVDGLVAKRFLINPLQEIISDKDNEKKVVPQWILFIALDDGRVLYPFENLNSEIYTGLKERQDLSQRGFVSGLVSRIPDNTNMINFSYQGKKGLCYYRNDQLPHPFRILQKPGYLIYLFLISMAFFIGGMVIMYSFWKYAKELIQASRRIREMDLDTPIKQKKKLKNEFSDVFSAFEEMRLQLKEYRAQGIRLIMSFTHDLKTPLTSMRMYLEALKDGIIETPEDGLQAVEKILQKSNLLEERINEMLDFSKGISTGQQKVHKKIAVQDWTKAMIHYFEEDCLIKNRSFLVKDELTENLFIAGNNNTLDRAVMNLFDNACRYSSAGDLIRFSLSVSTDKKKLILIMEDSGPGVALEDREIIFELFFRKDRGRNTRGMGIGLASVKLIVENHGGTISCGESSLGGAEFKMELPLI